GLQTPDRDDHRARDAELPLDALEHRRIGLHHALALGEPLGDAVGGELLEALVKDALPVIERDYLRIGGEPVQRRERAWRDALRRRVAAEGGEDLVEVAAALGGERRSSGKDKGGKDEQEARHRDTHSRVRKATRLRSLRELRRAGVRRSAKRAGGSV